MPMVGPGCRNASARVRLVGERHRVTIASRRAHHDGGVRFWGGQSRRALVKPRNFAFFRTFRKLL